MSFSNFLSKREITSLDEAISIAKSLGIVKPSTFLYLANDSRTSSDVIRTEVNSQQEHLYFMGTDTLNAERASLMARTNDDFTSSRIVEINTALKILDNNRQIEILNARENDDLFLEELAENRKEIARLNNIEVDMDKLKLVRIDQSAVEPTRAIKPNKKMIVAVGIILGGMLGVFIALIRIVIRKRKELRAQL